MNYIERKKLLSSPLRYFLIESNLNNFLRENEKLTIFANTDKIQSPKWVIIRLKHNTYKVEFNQGIQYKEENTKKYHTENEQKMIEEIITHLKEYNKKEFFSLI